MAGRNTVENVDITVTAKDDASKVIAAVGDTMARELGDGADVQIDATDDATATLDKVATKADEVDKADPRVIITAAGFGDILADLDAVQAAGDDTRAKLAGIGDGAGEASAETKVSMGDVGQALGQVNGPLGDLAGTFDDMASGADSLFSGLGGGLSGLAGPLGIAAGAVAGFWKMWGDQADEAKKKLDAVKDAQIAMAGGDISAAVDLITKSYDKFKSSLDAAGISQADYTAIVMGTAQVTDDQKRAMAESGDALGLQGRAIDDVAKQWEQATEQVTKQQTSQFEVAKAMGATTDQLLTQAQSALPAVRAQILQYVAAQEGIPAEKLTTVLTDADPDDVAQVRKILDDMAKDRDSTVTADAQTADAEADLNHVARPRTMTVTAFVNQVMGQLFGGSGGGGASTRAVGPTGRGIGPRLGGVGGFTYGAPVINVTVTNANPLTSPAEIGAKVADALDAFYRRNGTRSRGPV